MRFLKSLVSINPASLTLCAILVVVILFVSGIPILDLIELKTYDLRFLSRGHVQPSPAVVMAVIDEKSLETEGRWPWPRSKLAALVDILSHDGARVIGFDIGFLEPDENSQLRFIQQFGQRVEALAIKHPQLVIS
jgi:adenylate cyclase